MVYITRDQLLEYGPGTQKGRMAASWRLSSRTSLSPSVFLSHSHVDKSIVEPTANFLAGLGVSVYVDWLDPGMPAVTSLYTARRIREMIRANRRFVVLATPRSLESRWVPWELGYADGEKDASDIAIFPIAETWYRSAPCEYIQVYPRIEMNSGEWYIFPPGQDRGTRSLKNWLLTSVR